MRFSTTVVLGALLLAASPSLLATGNLTSPAGAGQVVVAFSGVPVSTETPKNPKEPYICVWYPLLLGDLDPASLFAPSAGGQGPAVNKEHAFLIWVSDYNAEVVSSTAGGFTLMLVPAGTATVYYKDQPAQRNWSDPTNRSTWGEPVATFIRKAGIFQSPDEGNSGTMISGAELVSATSFTLNGQSFNFKDLMPNGMTCFEAGVGVAESGTCVAIGGPAQQTLAVAGPKDQTVVARQIQLDGSKSTSADGNPLTYLWTIPAGSPSAAILGATTPTPSVQFAQGRAAYFFELTVTDSAGKSSTDFVMVNYQGN
ncbi:PKD domain-containing protein [Paludibaculum fermentans]|uniref:PKD domain-containing protein n=1 Tax=Paludibaculum fermentans TaxID=1473598 RepID=UPI003EC0CC33